ncbi:hypothetical protein GOODEAATRI_032638 [Goodea atripinnis]|uniref:Uncharacterized protein n=1 Tax=Goodea atripinnis TaxID=208336 RepID=A0ABV0NIX2_9TELE
MGVTSNPLRLFRCFPTKSQYAKKMLQAPSDIQACEQGLFIWKVAQQRGGGVLSQFSAVEFLCNRFITGCVCIAPTTNFIALRPSKAEPIHNVEKASLLAVGRNWLIGKECISKKYKSVNMSCWQQQDESYAKMRS